MIGTGIIQLLFLMRMVNIMLTHIHMTRINLQKYIIMDSNTLLAIMTMTK